VGPLKKWIPLTTATAITATAITIAIGRNFLSFKSIQLTSLDLYFGKVVHAPMWNSLEREPYR
jgi:hypothetical protein